MQQGRRVAMNIGRELGGQPREAFRYLDRGSLATIGRAAAVAQFGKIHLSGFVAWLAWLFIHILFLIGFRNRLIVMIQWAWSYFTYERGARLITGDTRLPSWTGRSRQALDKEKGDSPPASNPAADKAPPPKNRPGIQRLLLG